MSVVHKPFYHLVQGALVGYIKLLGIVRTLFGGITAYRSSGTSAYLRNAETEKLTAGFLSKELKQIGNYKKGGVKGFDTMITRLQAQCYVLISDFVYLKDKHGNPYGWGVAEYSTPEAFMGQQFKDNVYLRTPRESYDRIFSHFQEMFPDAEEAVIRKFLK